MTLPVPWVVGWTLGGLGIAISGPAIQVQLLTAAILLACVVFTKRSPVPLKLFLWLTVPFLFPLMAIHGIINPNFEISTKVWGIPIRESGGVFAITVYANLAVFLSVAIAWISVNRDHAFDWFVSRSIPAVALAVFFQGISVSVLVSNRAEAVYKAQLARGIPAGPGLVRRLKAFPSVVLPIISSLINESEHRATSMWTRGFMRRDFSSRHVPIGQPADFIWIVAPFVFPGVLIYMLD